jgi:hypothetical protein
MKSHSLPQQPICRFKTRAFSDAEHSAVNFVRKVPHSLSENSHWSCLIVEKSNKVPTKAVGTSVAEIGCLNRSTQPPVLVAVVEKTPK